MKNRVLISMICLLSLIPQLPSVKAAENSFPQYQTNERYMEDLSRGTYVSGQNACMIVSWRLLGNESLTNQAFDIYRNGVKIHTTAEHDATCYKDEGGTMDSEYIVVKKGESIAGEKSAKVHQMHHNKGGYTNHYSYVDIPIVKPEPVSWERYIYDRDANPPVTSEKVAGTTTYDYGANDSTVGDLDGDGEYELVLKWEPSDGAFYGFGGFFGDVFIDSYEIDENNGGYRWRLDLGLNVSGGQCYSQPLVYDFDCDGKAEVAIKTAPGSKDGLGNYVTEVGDTEEIRNADNSITYSCSYKGQVLDGPEYLTVFDGDTGKAIYTTDYMPRETDGYTRKEFWGDDFGNRMERYYSCAAYLDGEHPSLVQVRGCYAGVKISVWDWNAEDQTYTKRWDYVSEVAWKESSLFGQGAHSLSVADIDNDGKDEIVFGSACMDEVIDENGKPQPKVVGNSLGGHGDALHVSDFNNDGNQEVFQVHENSWAPEGWPIDSDMNATPQPTEKPTVNPIDPTSETTNQTPGPTELVIEVPTVTPAIEVPGGEPTQYPRYSYPAEMRNALTGAVIVGAKGSGDCGKGVMANIDDNYAVEHPDTGLSQWWTAGSKVADYGGNYLPGNSPSGTRYFCNFTAFWDNDLGAELLDDTMIQKWQTEGGGRLYWERDSSMQGVRSNNGTKYNPSLSCDLWGDWREEIIMPGGDGAGETNPFLRIYTSAFETEYRLHTLMHDSQYRLAIAWQNTGYNQPPHTSYYIGSAALAVDENGNKLNYLAPKTPYTRVKIVDRKYPDADISEPSCSLNDDGSFDAAYNANVYPNGFAISGDDIKVSFNDMEGHYKANFGSLTGGGNFSFTAGIRDIPITKIGDAFRINGNFSFDNGKKNVSSQMYKLWSPLELKFDVRANWKNGVWISGWTEPDRWVIDNLENNSIGINGKTEFNGGYGKDRVIIKWDMYNFGKNDFVLRDKDEKNIIGYCYADTGMWIGHGDRSFCGDDFVKDPYNNNRFSNYIKSEMTAESDIKTTGKKSYNNGSIAVIDMQNQNGTVDSYSGDYYTVKTYIDDALISTEYYKGHFNGLGGFENKGMQYFRAVKIFGDSEGE